MKLEFSGNGVALEKCSIIYSNDDQNFKFERGENSKRNILGHCSLSPHVLYFILRLIDAIKKKQDHISHSPRILGNATYYEQNMICSIIV